VKTRFGISFIVLVAFAVLATCGTSYAQTLIGSPAAGWQSWSVDDILCGEELSGNTNGSTKNACIPVSCSSVNGPCSPGTPAPAPYWNAEFGASRPHDEHSPAEKNVGFCMTSTGDCQGIGGALFAPGTLQFWAKPFTPGNGRLGTGGARDNTVYFKNSGTSTRSGYRWNSYKATLYLNATAVPCGVNAFGWFETNSSGGAIGTRHELFSGTGEPRYSCALVPSSVGSTVTFTPTQYFGFYYSDVSEPACNDGSTDPQNFTPEVCPINIGGGNGHGCYAYTLFNLNEPRCTNNDTNPNGNTNGDHDFAIFSTNPGSSHATYWIAGEDPTDCSSQDGDCNLTIVRISSSSGGE
jgi:hypothetical protein